MIIITGASGGLGGEVAKLYKADGKTVVNISRRESPDADKNLLHDLSQGKEIEAAAKEVLAMDEPIEALINCIGVYSAQTVGDLTEAEIKRMMATNVKAPMLLISELIERLKKDGADIVNTISTSATKVVEKEALYAASKWALRGFTLNLQAELKKTPCRVISFTPGGFVSKLFEKATGVDNTKEGSWMKASELAKIIKFSLDLPKNMEVSEIIINRK